VLVQKRPVAYQEVESKIRPIASRFVRRGPEGVGFEVGDYDRTHSLVIDPPLAYSTFIGGDGSDKVNALAVDGEGKVYISVRDAGVLAPASTWRARIVPKPPPEAAEPETPKGAGGYRPWAELLARTFAVDVLACPRCEGHMKLLALADPASIARYLAAVGEATEMPPNRGPPDWKSRVLRRQALGDEEDGSHSGGGDEAP
jgi:hypothetical protein